MTANIPSHPGYKSYCRPVLFTSLSHFMLTVTWTDSKHGMFFNMKAFDFGRFEESYPLYHLFIFGELLTVTSVIVSEISHVGSLTWSPLHNAHAPK